MNPLEDRRSVRRHTVHVPLKYGLWKSETTGLRGESLNISENGVYFATHSAVERDDTLQLRFQMPEGIVDESPAEWLCTGQVVRVDRGDEATGRVGVAVRFDCYEVARPESTATIHRDPQSFRLGFFSRTAARQTNVQVKVEPERPTRGRRGMFF